MPDAIPVEQWRIRVLRVGMLAILALIVSLAWWTFRLAGEDYWQFWLNSGPVIGLATAAFGWAWGGGGLDRHPDLVSADPLRYARAVFVIATLPVFAIAAHFGESRDTAGNLLSQLRDVTIAAILFVVVFFVAILGWIFMIAPAQYFAFLIFGAPSRVALTSRHTVYVRQGERGGSSMIEALLSEGDRFPKDQGWWDASMRDRPVTISSGFMAASLLMLDVLST